LLEKGADYSVILITDAGDTIHTCSSTIQYEHTFKLSVYPNPIHTGGLLKIVLDYPGTAFYGAKAQVYTLSGQLLLTTQLKDRASLLHLPSILSAGAYFLTVYIDGQTKTVKLNVQ